MKRIVQIKHIWGVAHPTIIVGWNSPKPYYCRVITTANEDLLIIHDRKDIIRPGELVLVEYIPFTSQGKASKSERHWVTEVDNE